MKTNITLKIFLLLIIISGALGIYFATTQVPAKVNLLKKEKKDIEAAWASSKKELNSTKLKASTLSNQVAQANINLNDASTRLSTALQTQNNAKKTAAESNAKLAKAQVDNEKLQKDYDTALILLNDYGAVKKQLEEYKYTYYKGKAVSAEQIKKLLKELEGLTKPKPVVKTAPKEDGHFDGKVANVDPKYGFVMIMVNADKTGILKKGTILRVYDMTKNKYVGKMTVHTIRPRPAVGGEYAFCKVDRKMTVGIAENPEVGFIKAGNDVTTREVPEVGQRSR
jgi:hypothetical protein